MIELYFGLVTYYKEKLLRLGRGIDDPIEGNEAPTGKELPTGKEPIEVE